MLLTSKTHDILESFNFGYFDLGQYNICTNLFRFRVEFGNNWDVVILTKSMYVVILRLPMTILTHQ